MIPNIPACCPYYQIDPTDLPDVIRHTRTAHPEKEDEIRALTETYATELRARWTDAFKGSIKIDFVCADPLKMLVLREALAASDIVPLVFGAIPGPEGTSRVRMTLEV